MKDVSLRVPDLQVYTQITVRLTTSFASNVPVIAYADIQQRYYGEQRSKVKKNAKYNCLKFF